MLGMLSLLYYNTYGNHPRRSNLELSVIVDRPLLVLINLSKILLGEYTRKISLKLSPNIILFNLEITNVQQKRKGIYSES